MDELAELLRQVAETGSDTAEASTDHFRRRLLPHAMSERSKRMTPLSATPRSKAVPSSATNGTRSPGSFHASPRSLGCRKGLLTSPNERSTAGSRSEGASTTLARGRSTERLRTATTPISRSAVKRLSSRAHLIQEPSRRKNAARCGTEPATGSNCAEHRRHYQRGRTRVARQRKTRQDAATPDKRKPARLCGNPHESTPSSRSW